MASTINASTTLGLISTADTSGVLQLQTANTTAVTVNANQTVSLAVGTANGVTYLNGSKVLTSGSALTYNGTDLQFASGSGLFTNTSDGSDTATLAIGGGGANSTARGSVIELYGNENATAGVLDMTSGNVANSYVRIQGRSSTSYVRFDINASEQMRLTSTGLGIGTSSPAQKLHVYGSSNVYSQTETSSTANAGVILKNSQRTWYLLNDAGGSFSAYDLTAGATRLTLDSSGNLGLGVTPSAWVTNGKAIQFSSYGSVLATNSGDVHIINNAYLNSGASAWIYTNTGTASQYYQYQGQHVWRTAASGTAGNAITFTQAMTLDASGNLAVGTTSPLGIFHVNGVQDGTAGKNARFSYSGTYYLEVNEQSIRSFNNPLIFGSGTSGTERARIDSSGNLLVGTTTVVNPNPGISFTPGSGSQIAIGHGNGQASGTYYAYFVYNGTVIGSITQSGTTAVLYNTTSDQRLKENIQDADSASSLIDAIQVRQFDWKSDGSHTRYGFVAQELVTVAPEAVHQPADPDEMMAVDYSKLVPMLVKEIQSLRQRLSAANL